MLPRDRQRYGEDQTKMALDDLVKARNIDAARMVERAERP